MSEVFKIESPSISEESFESIVGNTNLTYEEITFLRRNYGLLHDKEVVSNIGSHCAERFVVIAHQKIMGNPRV